MQLFKRVCVIIGEKYRQRLKNVYSDAKTLLSNNLASVKCISPLSLKDAERLKLGLINKISELISLATYYHNIEGKASYSLESRSILYMD